MPQHQDTCMIFIICLSNVNFNSHTSLAFVKKENHENDRLESDVFSVYCADGTLLAAFESEESAIAAIIQSGLEYTNLH